MLVFGTDNKGSEFSGSDLEILKICGFVSPDWRKEWLETGEEQGIPVVVTNYGDVENVPPAGTEKFLVSAMVLARLGSEYRGWAFAPDTGATAIRNDKGQIEAVTQLVTVE